MRQLGHTLPCLIWTMANAAPDHGPIFFAKWDIKAGFWHLVVNANHAWHFCYVLPPLNDEPIQLVVPTSLQMGWCELPAFFCTTSKMAHDIAYELWTNTQPLPEHPLEHLCLPLLGTLPTINDEDMHALLHLLEVYINDFIGLIQAPNTQQLQHFTRAILHGIHCVFPPAHISNTTDNEPIALKTLALGDGIWSTQKEVLGWLINGLSCTIALPPAKIASLGHDLWTLLRCPCAHVKDLQCMQGCLIHACMGIPNGKGLLSPIVALVTKQSHTPCTLIILNATTKWAL